MTFYVCTPSIISIFQSHTEWMIMWIQNAVCSEVILSVKALTLGAKCSHKVPPIIKRNLYSELRWITLNTPIYLACSGRLNAMYAVHKYEFMHIKIINFRLGLYWGLGWENKNDHAPFWVKTNAVTVLAPNLKSW